MFPTDRYVDQHFIDAFLVDFIGFFDLADGVADAEGHLLGAASRDRLGWPGPHSKLS